jgi:4-oxalocrotonate tautomerase
MPFVRIDLLEGQSDEYRKAIADGVHRDRGGDWDSRGRSFSGGHGTRARGLIYDPQYFGEKRRDQVVFVQIITSFGRKPQQKRQP